MGLCKEIFLDTGIPLNYHRVVSVNNITNHSSIIEIASYVNQSKRLEEKENIKNNVQSNIFIHTQYLEKEYEETFNVVSAYHYLKSLDKFAGASDC